MPFGTPTSHALSKRACRLTSLPRNCGTSVRMIETAYAKVLAGKRREFIARGAPRLFSDPLMIPLTN